MQNRNSENGFTDHVLVRRIGWNFENFCSFNSRDCGDVRSNSSKMLNELSRLGVIEKISGTEFSVYRINMAGEKLDDIGKAVCEYCSSSEGHLEFDHVIPVSRGGKDDLANMAFSCRPCNNAKSNKTPSEWLGEVRHAVVPSL